MGGKTKVICVSREVYERLRELAKEYGDKEGQHVSLSEMVARVVEWGGPTPPEGRE